MRFDATLQNAKPPGEIQTKGEFGPLVLFDAGATPVSGDYVFADADLSVFKGIGGTLYSEGRFDGVLERIDVKGLTRTPDFQLTSAGTRWICGPTSKPSSTVRKETRSFPR